MPTPGKKNEDWGEEKHSQIDVSFEANGHGRNWVRRNDEPWRDWNHPSSVPTHSEPGLPSLIQGWKSFLCKKGRLWTGPSLGVPVVHWVWRTGLSRGDRPRRPEIWPGAQQQFQRRQREIKDGKGRSLSLSLPRGMKPQLCALVTLCELWRGLHFYELEIHSHM